MQKAQEDNAAKATGGSSNVFRFTVKKGESTEIMILDEAPSEFRYEHDDYNGKYVEHYNCVRDTHGDHCPACQSLEKSSYYGMFLSVIDFTEFTTKKGDTVDFSRKLLCVKPFTFDKWKRRMDRCLEDNGTLRGAVFEVSRSSGSNSPATGDDLSFMEMDSDIDVDGAYIKEWTDKEGKAHEEDCTVVLDYDSVLCNESESELRDKFGTAAPAGSREADEGFDEEDEPPFDQDEKPQPTRRGGRGSRGRSRG